MNSTKTRVGILLGAICLSSASSVADTTPVWSEEFDESGAPNPDVWSYDLGYLGVNQELQVYTDSFDNIRVADGTLVITARREADGSFTSGRIRTQDKVMFQYGTVEARIKIPDLGNGLWPAFWTLGNDISSVGWPRCGEIDILEMGAAEAIQTNTVNRQTYSTVHWDVNGQYANYGLHLTTDADLNDDFHVWRMEWTPDSIMTFIDGEHIWTMNISEPSGFSGEEFHAPHFLILNLAVGGWFPGITNPNEITAPLPAEYVIDYVRLYDNGHTILSGTGVDDSCEGDINADGAVDGVDLSYLLGTWARENEAADFNNDGTVDGADLTLLLGRWGACP